MRYCMPKTVNNNLKNSCRVCRDSRRRIFWKGDRPINHRCAPEDMPKKNTTENANAMSSEEDRASQEKLAKLIAALDSDLSEECVGAILQMEGDVNYAIPLNEHLESSDRKLQPGTVLHQLRRLEKRKIPKMMNLLLEYGVDITKTNGKGHTALHTVLTQREYADNWEFASSFDHPIVESILSAHVDHSIHQNPCDDNGISHFHVACMSGHTRAVEFFLDAGVDVNRSISSNSPRFPGCSPLHLAVIGGHVETTKLLLKHGANACSKNAKGLTPVSALIKRNLSIMNWEVGASDFEIIREYKVNQLMLRLLLASGEVNDNNISSGTCTTTATRITADEHGFTSFHAACACDDTLLAKNLRMYVDDVNQSISADSPLWPGYTPMHFAAQFNVELVKALFAEGGDLTVKDAKGVTPLDIFLQRHQVDDVHDLLAAHPSWRNILMSDKRTKLLDLFGAMRSQQDFRSFLDSLEDADSLFLDESSPLCPGYTLAHFAVLFTDRVASKFHEFRALRGDDESNDGDEDFIGFYWLYDECLNRGVVDAVCRDARHRATFLHLSFFLQHQYFVEVTLEDFDGDRLSDLIDDDNLSLLHLACSLPDIKRAVIKRAIAAGADVNFPMSSSIRLKCETFHPADDTPLRYFLVAGTTPLHMAVTARDAATARLLLRHGADVNATNVEGWSPLHVVMLTRAHVGKAMLSLAANLREKVVEGVGLSHLHVACHCGRLKGAKRLIELGSDVNAVVRFEPMPAVDRWRKHAGCRSALDLLRQTGYAGFTPLHFAVKTASPRIVAVLLEAGADVLAKDAKGVSLLYEVLTTSQRNEQLVDLFVGHLRDDESLQARLKEDSGLTMLHVLAFRMDVEEVQGVDVNVKLRDDSPIWPGCTALHAWVHGAKARDLADDRVRNTLKRLLDGGADVTLASATLDTPLHLFDRSFAEIDDEIGLSTGRLLLGSQKDFGVNPTNADGISHFHIAVRMRAVGVVEEFLKGGVDVNQRIHVFSSDKPGCTALHLLAHSQYLQALPSAGTRTLNLLLSRGADARARDVFGNTPLHAIAEARGLAREDFTRKIVGAGGIVHVANSAGETPFAVMLNLAVGSRREVDFFLRQGCRLNDYTAVGGTGFLALPLCSRHDYSKEQLSAFYEMLFENPDVTCIDDAGRTALHNVASSRAKSKSNVIDEVYVEVIERLVKLGCDIDAQDQTGKTALHTAAHFKSNAAVAALLMNGADVNLIDDSNKSALDYALDVCDQCNEGTNHRHLDLIETILIHMLTLKHLQLDVSERDKNVTVNVVNKPAMLARLETELIGTKSITVVPSSSLRLYDFLFETRALTAYPTMSHENRRAVEKFFTTKNEMLEQFDLLRSVFTLQYKKLVKRAALIDRASGSLRDLSGTALPQLCSQRLLRYLSLSDVQNLVASTNNSLSVCKRAELFY